MLRIWAAASRPRRRGVRGKLPADSERLRPLVMLPGVLMVATVAVGFMEVKRGIVLVRAFAVAAMFWLLVLLALGSVDALTRTDYHVP